MASASPSVGASSVGMKIPQDFHSVTHAAIAVLSIEKRALWWGDKLAKTLRELEVKPLE